MLVRFGALLVSVLFLMTPYAPGHLSSQDVEDNQVQGAIHRSIDGPTPLNLDALLSGLGGSFTENLGQVEGPGVRYYAQGDPLSVAFERGRVLYSYSASDGSFAFFMHLEGANDVEPVGVGDMDRSANFFLGKDPEGWVRNARSFEEVLYRNVYDGVDLRFYFMGGLLKYDLLVEAHVDPDVISVRYEGLDSIEVDPATGDLLLSCGSVCIRDMRPVIMQEGLGAGGVSPGDYRLTGKASLRFQLPFDCLQSLPLVIDPGMEFSTLIGGNLTEAMTCCEVDPEGNIVMAGFAVNSSFPLTPGAYRTEENSSKKQNVAVVKMDPTLSRVLFSTIIGGPDHDWAQDLEIGPNGTIYLVGAASDGFPVTDDAFDKDTGDDDDAFLVVLSADGAELLYSGYIGGEERELGLSVHLYEDASVLVFGSTNSSDLYTTSGAFCETYVRTFPIENPYVDSLFLAKLRPSLDSIEFCSYVNGFSTSSIEAGLATMFVDGSGNIFLAACTDWPDFPVTDGAFSTTFSGGTDCAVMKLDPTCSDLIYSTFLGGGEVDAPSGLTVDTLGRPWVVGVTHSSDFWATPDAYQFRPRIMGNGFMTVLDSDLSAINYSTYFGGSEYTAFDVIQLDEDAERYYLLGGTSAPDLPVSDGCFNPVYPGEGDPFVATFNMTTHDLDYCSYLGGSRREGVHQRAMILDGQGNMIVVGRTPSNDFPVTSGAYSTSRNGSQDAFALVLDPTPLEVPSPPEVVSLVPGDGFVNISWDPPGITQGRIIGHRIFRGHTVEDMARIKDVKIDRNYFMDRGVVNGVEYLYSVSAINSAGEGAPSESEMVRPFGLPSPPTDLNATTGDGTVVLNWSSPSDTGGPEISGYYIYRAEGEDDPEPYATVGNVTGYTDIDVERGEEYRYAVSAFTSAGNSTLTPTLVITAEGLPDPPTAFSLEAANNRVVLRWKAPINDGGRNIEGYHILRGTRPGELVFLTEVGPTDREHIDGGLENGKPYFYRMMAINAHGPGRPSPILTTVPVGLPGAPTDLRATPSNGYVTLLWSPPVLDGGTPIVSYKVHVGTSRTTVSLFTELGPVVTYIDTGLTNGVTLYYAISAVNDEGEGELSTVVEATPLGIPGPPTELTASNDVEGVLLEWRRPVDKGGATSLIYRILRGTSPEDLVPLDEVLDTTAYLDTGVTAREDYHYAVRSMNPIGGTSERTPVVTIAAILGPGPVTNVSAVRGDGLVFVTWSPPVDDGGSPITGYIVYQGPTEADLEERVRPGNVLSHSDRSLENGRTYFYVIVAINSIGQGGPSVVVNATPVPVPGAPQGLTVRYTDGGVVLEWLHPERGVTAPVTGYRVYRRTEGAHMELLKELGPVLNHTDGTVISGRIYFYSVAAVSDVGEGAWANAMEVSTGISTWWVWGGLVLALLGAAAIGIVVVRWRQALDAKRIEALSRTPDGLTAPTNVVEEVYLVYGDGRLIATCSREECQTQDADLTSSMLIAIQGMVQDGLERGGDLESIKSGDNLVMMERGVHLNLAVVVYGRPDDELKEELESTVAQIEGTYAGVVEDWTGDRSVFEGVDVILDRLLESTAHLTREDLDRAMARYQVALLSALDLYRGYVRLKVAAMNATPDSVTDASIEVRYDPAMLRLERVEPDTLTLRGDTAVLGNVKAGEKRTVSFLFDPLICQETYIDGTISYHDALGDIKRTSMKRRHATVVCPIFFTKEHANTAMLRRLVSEELDMTDARVFRYPGSLGPWDVLRAGKLAQGGGKVQLVREFVVSGPPFEAEVWYYGETQVKGYQMVMRLRVLEKGHLLEFFAASTAMEPITGLLAEFRRDLLDVLRERYHVEDVVEIARDEGERQALETRELLLND